MKVIVYTTPTCPFCVAVKKFLTEKKIEFKNVDVTKDESGRDEMIEKSGQMSVPVTRIIDSGKESYIVGFEPDKLIKALKLEVAR